MNRENEYEVKYYAKRPQIDGNVLSKWIYFESIDEGMTWCEEHGNRDLHYYITYNTEGKEK